MDPNDNESEELLESAKQEGMQNKAQESDNYLRKKATEKLVGKATEKLGMEAIKQQMATQVISALAPLLPYIAIAVLIILAIIMIIGILAFAFTMPGLMQDKISAIFSDVAVSIQSIYKGDVDASVTNEDVIELADYINKMQYDLIGYGFVKPDRDLDIKTIEELNNEGYTVSQEPNPDKDKSGEPKYLIFLVDENGNKYNNKFYYTDGKKYGPNGKPYTDENGNYTRYEIGYDQNGKVVSLPDDPSSVLRTYAMSERRLYVLRNNDKGFVENVFTFLNQVINGYSGAWAQGLLELYPSVDGRAEEGLYTLWDSITQESKITITDNNKLNVKTGWLQNKEMNFDLEGWSGRYGLSTDFLIALHIATLSPDLVTTLVQTYDTRAQVYLDHITNASVTAYFHTNDMENDEEGNPKYISREELLAYKNNSNINLFDSWFLSKKEAKKIMDDFKIKSLSSGKYICGGTDPSQVLYYSGEGSDRVKNGESFTQTYDDIDWYDNVFKDQYFENYSSWEEALNVQVINEDKGEKATNTDNDKYIIIKKSNSIVGTDEDALDPNDNNESEEDVEDKASVSKTNVSVEMESNNNDFRPTKLKNVLGMLNKYYKFINTSTDLNIVEFKTEQECPLNYCNIFDPESKNKFENYFNYTEFKTMSKDKEQYYECEIAVWPTNDSGLKAGDPNYKPEEDSEIVLSLLFRRTGGDQNYDIAAIAYRNYSMAEMMNNGFNPGNPEGITLCSEPGNTTDTVCSNCRRYISHIISALGKIEEDEFETYEPYLARVVGSWFRDTYMIIPETDDDATEMVYKEYDEYKEGSLTISQIDVIENDMNFLEETGELWTDYLYDDKNLTYALFVVNSDGSFLTSQEDIENWKKEVIHKNLPQEIYNSIGVLNVDGKDYYGYIYVYPDTNPNLDSNSEITEDIEKLFEEHGVACVKRAKTTKVTPNGTIDNSGGWSAYSYSDSWSDEKVPIDVIDAPGKIQKVHDAYNADREDKENIFYYSISANNVVTQKYDGQRGITNEKIKYLFKNKKYYKYDGTVTTSYAIKDDWNECINIFQNSSEMKLKNLETELLQNTRGAIRNALFGYADLFNSYSNDDKILSSAQEAVLNGYIDSIYYSNISNSFEKFKFARDFDGDGNADLISKNLENKLKPGDYFNEDGVKLLVTEETKFAYDPRNPELIHNIDLNTESLAAFSILENTHTSDADYAYRDLKELICELDYFDKEDLTEQPKDVLEWILPETGSASWPNRRYDKMNEYGTLIHSKEMYTELDEVYMAKNSSSNIIETYTNIINNADEKISNLGNSNPNEVLETLNIQLQTVYDIIKEFEQQISSDKTEEAKKEEYKNLINEYENKILEIENKIEEISELVNKDENIEKDDDILLEASTQRIASRNNTNSKVLFEEVSDDKLYHCESTTTINGVTYRNYKQNYYEWGAIPYSEQDYSRSACGATSVATILSGYGKTCTPLDVGEWLTENTTEVTALKSLALALENYGVVSKSYFMDEWTVEQRKELIRNAWSEGKPVLVNVRPGEMTSCGHYIVCFGEIKGEYGFSDTALVLNQVSGSNQSYITDKHLYIGGLDAMIEKNPLGSIIIPDSKPTGLVKVANVFDGFEKGQPVVSPATAKILEIGTVKVDNENTNDVLKTIYVSSEESLNNTENDEESQEISQNNKLVVSQDEYDSIKGIALSKQDNLSSPFGKSYETGYIKLEIIGESSLTNIKESHKDKNVDLTYLDNFLDDYCNDYNKQKDDGNVKSICDNYVIYIEGIDLRYDENGEWTFDNTVINNIIKNNLGKNGTNTSDINSEEQETVTRGDNSVNSNNIIELYNSATQSKQPYTIDNYTKRKIPDYYPLAKRQELSMAEDRKANGASIIETVNKEIYIKAGTLLGVTTDANIKIIMKDKDNAVVENVEDYLEIEEIGTTDSGTSLNSDMLNFYFLPYESGGSKVGTYTYGSCSSNEVAIGLIQWTTMPNLSGVQNLCKFLSEADPSFCGSLAGFANWSNQQVISDLKSSSTQIGTAFKELDDQNHEKLLALEIKAAEDYYKSFIEAKGTSWILERSSGLVGSYYALLAWAPYASNPTWESAFDPSKSDKQMLLDLMYNACQHTSTAGKLNDRWHSQCKLGVDMIENTVSEEQVIEWIEIKGDSEIYEEYKAGAHGGKNTCGPGDYIYDEGGRPSGN